MSFTEITDSILTSVKQTDLITWIATITAVLYVILALKESIWCWSFGIVSSGLSIGVYVTQELYYESLLSVFYVVLGVYGWISWSSNRRGREVNGDAAIVNLSGTKDKQEVHITLIPQRILAIVCFIGVAIGLLLGFASDTITGAQYAYMDAMVTSFSVLATWMTARKFLENWIFWIFIDACSAILYIVKGPGMYLFALLFIFYTFMAVAGYFAWRKNLRR